MKPGNIPKKPFRNPKLLFLVDAVGGCLTAFALFFVLPEFNQYFRIPSHLLPYLSAIALVYAIYSISCYYFANEKQRQLLRIIGFANLAYCLLTAFLLIQYRERLTIADFTYFISEIIIISLLAYFEITSANLDNSEKF